MKIHKKTATFLVLILTILFGLIFWINGLFYPGDQLARTNLNSTSEVTVTTTSSYYAFMPTNKEVDSAFILYPGALVDADAYAPLMMELSSRGIPSFIAKMPLDMAILKSDVAAQIVACYPDIQNWYIGGHSLGGVMAANYALKNPDSFKGIAFLASYPNKDLSGTDFKALSLYGTNDTVLNMESYEQSKPLLPDKAFTEIVIDGGNHANFGNYGAQSGDSPATISAEEQQHITVSAILKMIED